MTESRERPPPRTDRRSGARGRREERTERLQKVLARAGYGSRRAAEELIRQGRVAVDGRVAALGDQVDPVSQTIMVDGAPVPAHPDLRYYAFNKPAGVTTTLRDPHASRTIARSIPAGPRVFPVGRLDRDSEGLLLLTNDGDLANRLQHPAYGVEKEYLVEVEGAVARAVPAALIAGLQLEEGTARARRATVVQRAGGRSSLRIVMGEGRKREVRRMLAAVGFPVRRLVRLRIGPVRLGSLPPGEVRALRAEEIEALYRAARLERAAPSTPH